MYNRYGEIEKFITDPSELEMTNGSEVYLSREEHYDIVADLQGRTEEFEQLRPFLAFVAQSICELDNTAQRFDRLHSRSSQFPYVIAVVYIDGPYVILEYWGTEENTQFDVVFEYKQGMFTLKSFGTILDIPPDWEQTIPVGSGRRQSPKRGFLRKLMDWLSF